jgi:acetyltransferase-like isoleucine patch superfamily enzyme
MSSSRFRGRLADPDVQGESMPSNRRDLDSSPSPPAAPYSSDASPHRSRFATSPAALLRFSWGIFTCFVVESFVVGVAALPAVLFWRTHLQWQLPAEWMRIVLLAMSLIPAYLVFSISLMMLSAGVTRMLGWRSPADATLRIRDFSWPLLDWGRYLVSIHVVRVLTGTMLRTTPIWSMYLRMNGARVGRGVFVNSLYVNDHNLLELGDGVVIGDSSHLSGHTVERGFVKTARVRLGRNVTIGLESVIGIGVEIGAHTQVGALSLVPKNSRLLPESVYVGIPVRRLADRGDPAAAPQESA